MLRTIRLDPSDTIVFERAAAPGEPAVVGGFMFWDVDPATLAGKARQAFRAGFLGIESFGWSTLVTVGSATAAERAQAVAMLAAAIRDRFGAPSLAAAAAAAEEEIAYAEGLCAGHPPGTVIALSRTAEGGVIRERFRTLRPRGAPQALPVIGIVRAEGEAEEPAEPVDLLALLRGQGR